MRSPCSLGSPSWKVSGLCLPHSLGLHPVGTPWAVLTGRFPLFLSLPQPRSLLPGILSREPLCLAPAPGGISLDPPFTVEGML